MGTKKKFRSFIFFFQWFEKQRFGNLFPKPVFKIGGEKKLNSKILDFLRY